MIATTIENLIEDSEFILGFEIPNLWIFNEDILSDFGLYHIKDTKDFADKKVYDYFFLSDYMCCFSSYTKLDHVIYKNKHEEYKSILGIILKDNLNSSDIEQYKKNIIKDIELYKKYYPIIQIKERDIKFYIIHNGWPKYE